VLIAGNFGEYPFSLLLEIFLLRRETGLLEVSSSDGSGYFYIKNGKVKDGQIGKSKGLAAVNVVRKFNDAAFRFKQLEPDEYARVVWQRRFGPTGPAIGQLPIPAPAIETKLDQFSFDPVALNRVLTDLRPSTQRALRQVPLYMSTAYHGLQKLELSLRRRTVACASAGYALWRRAQIETRIRRILENALVAAQEKRRHDRQLRPTYPRKVSFKVPTIPAAAITSALRQGVEHNVIFAFTLTILLGVSGVMLYQLVNGNQDPVETGFTIDEHFDISPQNTRPIAKPKRERKTRRATEHSRPKSRSNKPAEPSTQDSGVVPETSPIGAAPIS
jgi:hypothetical protein